ncbi:MAG: hypothetical protein IJT41_13060 [Clostridia bacterium]|nr:hypothetical protein [Clostridia bacterium]
MDEDEILDGRITEPIEIGYIYVEDVGGSAPDFAREKLGLLEDLIENGELMNPAVKPGDTVFFVYKNTVVLEGVLARAFTEYDAAADKYFFYADLRSDFYGLFVVYPSADYGKTWFKTKAEADAALLTIQEAEEGDENENGNDPEQAQGA